uniref:Craniofacial development protein 2 n=1 Tax=Cacopsylla melanoneura TaxID=428564 RepID=A0A8D8S3W4_9HEMI
MVKQLWKARNPPQNQKFVVLPTKPLLIMDQSIECHISGLSSHSDPRVSNFLDLTCNVDVAAKHPNSMRIGTWNVNTLNKPEKLENLKREIEKCKLDILGLSETHWEGEGEKDYSGYKIVYKGGEQKYNGVGFMYKTCVEKHIMKIIPMSDRVIGMRLNTTPVDTLLIQVYMPPLYVEEEKVDGVYKQIEEIIEDNGKGQVRLMIIGDFNSIVGETPYENIVGKFGLGKRNERGEKLIEFCKTFKLWISNTWFKNHKRRLYTWKSPGDRYRNQIDFILVNQRFKNSISNSKTYPGADAKTDHNLLVADVRTSMKHVKKSKAATKWNVDKLEGRTKLIFQGKMDERMKNIQFSNGNTKQEWDSIKEALVKTLSEEVGKTSRVKKKEWITEGMIEKMDERRKYKNIETEEGRLMYKKLNNQLRRETDKARETWTREQCERIEEMERKGNMEELYKTARNLTKCTPRIVPKQGMMNKEGNITTSMEETKIIWKEYIEELYQSDISNGNMNIEPENEREEDEKGPRIEKWEVEKALNDLKKKKALGCDHIPSEALKALGPEAISRLTNLINNIYFTGTWPEDLLKTILVPLPKKSKAKECKDYRTISCICHLTKAITRIILKRIDRKIEENMGEDQFGFRKGKGTRDAIGCLRMLGERVLEVNREIFVSFVDWEKAFDRVDWRILMRILRDVGVDWRDRRLISEIYRGQKVVVRLGDEETEEIGIGRGVRQGCCMSPTLFNLYAERIMNEALEETQGLKVGGESIKTIKYADDQAIIATTPGELENMLERVSRVGEENGMRINVGKTKVMKIGKEETRINITLGGQQLEQVNSFKYLGAIVNSEGNTTEEIRKRIGMAKTAYTNMKGLMNAKKLPIGLRVRFAKCYEWSVFCCMVVKVG